ncbi:NAD(P)H-quinone oxidoreductase chain 4 1 [Aquisphaera giovannonii]|uniref:NAD(P)H-quinone oxidoreductase chain 4 1 n=1 Tax=Aquisphaera giovannonii TaxID=406548 RepID=A0A5B9VWY0_9BACT|nr:NADH-quinone oxidoreductase subunit M [Aquisphaera giovannonii]QEH32896.1 NAD(P)H-quinone oxidoreductase chain 4 1 [Aquisphaera giovannonii]
MSDNLLLTSLWLVPLLGVIATLLVPRRQEAATKYVALGFTGATFVLSVVALGVYLGDGNARRPLAQRVVQNTLQAESGGLLTIADESTGGGDLVVRRAWIPYFNIQYYLGLDGISLSLVVLTGLISLLACLASWNITKQVKGYYALYMLLVASMMGVFLSLDLFLFYVFFEVMLLPMYFLIAIWGGDNREYAAIKFLLYTLFGSVFILVSVLILYFWQTDLTTISTINATGGSVQFRGHSFDIVELTNIASTTSYYGRDIQAWVFILFLVGFMVKLPSFPFHTWLPDAHVQAPTPISMILAGILLKIGGYGMIRLAWPLAPAGAYDWSYFVAALGVFSILYGALVAMAQTDFKKLVAYSSVSHMGYVTLGLAVMNLQNDPQYYAYGVNGAMFMMLAHGITSAGMFFLVGVIYDRAHTRDLDKLGGLNNIMPLYGAISYVIFFGSMGLPGLCGFVAEVFVVLASFNYSIPLAVLAAMAVILTAGYILWTIQRVFLGRSEAWKGLPDMDLREVAIAVPLVVLTIAMGVFPNALVLRWMSPSVDQMVDSVVHARELNVQVPRTAEHAPPPAQRTAIVDSRGR